MGKVYIATCAFNAEKTIKRCVESVLHQSFADFVYYLCDNASTDQTGKIIEQYAARDKRIVPSHNKTNHDWSENLEYALLPHTISEEDYFCLLDADDELAWTFFEEMLLFLKKENLDMVVCGNDFVNSANGKLTNVRQAEHSVVLQDAEGFSKYFSFYYQFMRTGWAKVYSGKIAHKRYAYSQYPPEFPKAYGGDTYNVFRCLREAQRVGIYSKSLYRYYLSPDSVSHRFHPQRVECDRILHEDAVDFLKTKCGVVSPKNLDFLFGVYMNALIDTSHVLLSAKIDLGQKLDHLREMMDCAYTRQLAARENFGDVLDAGPELRERRKAHFRAVADWLLTLQEVPDGQVESFCDMGEFACAAAEHAEGWVFFNKLRIRLLIDQGRAEEGRAKLGELEEVLPGDADLAAFRAQLPQ